ncbi:hypothetical protein CL630_01775 [bacterium]|nr:hypothetical protein [bacterium]
MAVQKSKILATIALATIIVVLGGEFHPQLAQAGGIAITGKEVSSNVEKTPKTVDKVIDILRLENHQAGACFTYVGGASKLATIPCEKNPDGKSLDTVVPK